MKKGKPLAFVKLLHDVSFSDAEAVARTDVAGAISADWCVLTALIARWT